jgi:hypothetical protein
MDLHPVSTGWSAAQLRPFSSSQPQLESANKEDPLLKILRRFTSRNYACCLTAAIAALALYSFYVRELLVGLMFFSAAFLLLILVVLLAIFIWWTSQRLVNWAAPVSRRLVAFSRRLSPRT